jgi:hypothetical protein
METIKPKEITRCEDTEIDTASFEYYSGIKEAKVRNLKQTTNFIDVVKYTHFIVSCGEVMIRVNHEEYPEIERRIF